MLNEHPVTDRIIGFVALECQVLLHDVDIIAVAVNVNISQKLEQLLVTDLLRALRHRIDLSLELGVLEFKLVAHRLRQLQQAHINFLLLLLLLAELNVIVADDLIHLLFASEQCNHF